jgi:hypothetical protein
MLLILIYLTTLAFAVYGSQAALTRLSRQSVWSPRWRDLLESALVAAVVTTCTFWILFVAFGVAIQIKKIGSDPKLISYTLTAPSLGIVMAGIFGAISMLFMVLTITLGVTVLLGSPAAIASYLILNDWSRLHIAWTPLLGALCSYAAMRNIGLYGDTVTPFGAIITAIAGAAGGYAFGRRMQRKDALRGYIW